MGLMNKLKNILFEEEEVEIPVIEKKEKKNVAVSQPVYKEMPRKEEVSQQPQQVDYSNFYDSLSTQPSQVQAPQQPVSKPVMPPQENRVSTYSSDNLVSEREMFRSEKTFNFPAFDEEEFESIVPRARNTNVMEHERKKAEKRIEKAKVEKKEEKVVETVKFRPSPIISPVYGILDKNYTPDEITAKNEAINSRTLDVDTVRKKAFGTPSTETLKTDTLNSSLDEKILEEKLEKARTIDELLKDSSDDVITLPNDTLDIKEKNIEGSDFANSLDEMVDSLDNIEQENSDSQEDTLESDLFDLIDSMYENREEGE